MIFLKKLTKANGFIAGAALSATAFFFIHARSADDPYFEISKNLDIYTNLFKELNTYYVDPIEPGKLVKTGVDAMLDDLDPYTNYITESDVEDYEFMTTGKYGGIGANMHRKGDDIFVGDVYENSPAQKAGLHPGDVVISVDNQQVKGKSVDDLSLLLKGSPGTQLTLKIKDAYTGVESSKIITRGEIEISSVPYASLIGPGKDIAYVKLTQFTQGCARQVRNAYDSLKKAQPALKGLVLDVRNNPGGLVDEAVNICNIFVDRDQTVVTTRGKIPDMDKDYKTAGTVWNKDLPLTVLVNKSSASASEIVAGTMQDLDRGVIIGERSYGKGLVQVTRPLGFNAHLKLTIARYYTPSGRCIQALDYTHRNADHSVSTFADSLKKSYKTRNGRTVLSGGGIEPDVKIKDDPTSQLAITLYVKNYLFDYATDYAGKHKSIADPTKFSLTEAEFADFTKWLDKKDYSYKTETESELDSLKAIAVKEKYYDDTKAEFDALKAKLSHDKKQDLQKNKEAVKQMLENEIVSRYYFSKGRIAQNMQHDKELDKAVALIASSAEFDALLKVKK
ncbi:peptidase S41 [Flavipsychrobacter stenotrophus]|uniref:Peptidase S41 n=1 Tax=Flavipsychrobacter stenotrophus TaxID=2077091 RepID=A0A2S7SYQ3_9BACT|nr:S41 family peptidase [Flavipsychrobacter stenotrophus]PQJ12052.1 peptidase S41 [Flavipsychrobacter stenotrophus]